MKQSNEAIRRAIDALSSGEDEHPGYDVLEAYVDGRLTAEQRADVEHLASRSAIVAEDIADLQRVREGLTAAPVARRNVQWGRIAVAGAIAATVILAVWIGRPGQTPAQLATSDEARRVQLAVTSGRITLPANIASLRAGEGTLLGTTQPALFRLQTPVGSAVLPTRPLFTWDDAHADAYTVAVFDQNFVEVARGRTDGTSWQPDVDLRRGATYSWQVTAHRGAENVTEPKPPRPEARFAVVDAATADRVNELRARLAGDPLTLGVLLAESGLIVDARIELARAVRDPQTAAMAQRLFDYLDQGTPITTKPAQ